MANSNVLSKRPGKVKSHQYRTPVHGSHCTMPKLQASLQSITKIGSIQWTNLQKINRWQESTRYWRDFTMF